MKKNRIISAAAAAVLIFGASGCTERVSRPIPPLDLRSSRMEAYAYKFDMERIKKDVREIAREDVFRVQGSEEEKRVRDYITGEFKNAGLEVRTYPFTAENALIEEEGRVTAVNNGETFPSKGVDFSPGIAETEAELSDATDFTEEDFKTKDLKGTIVLLPLKQGEDIVPKAALLKERGAVAIISYIIGSGTQPGQATSSGPTALPVRTISEKNALLFSSTRSRNENFRIKIASKTINTDISTENIIAEIKSENPEAQNIIFTAYTDSPGDPGAASDAAGIALLLEAARILKDKKMDVNIIFAVVSAAEIRGTGEKELIKELGNDVISKNIAVFALDSIGRSIDIKIITKDDEASAFFEDMFKKAGKDKYVTGRYFDEFGRILSEGGLKTATLVSEEDTMKNKSADKAWTLDYPRVSDTMQRIFDLTDPYVVK